MIDTGYVTKTENVTKYATHTGELLVSVHLRQVGTQDGPWQLTDFTGEVTKVQRFGNRIDAEAAAGRKFSKLR